MTSNFFIHNNGELVERLRLWTCKLVSLPCEGSNLTLNNIFCNFHLFRVPRSWAGSVQMKSRMTFIRGKKCIEREKDNF